MDTVKVVERGVTTSTHVTISGKELVLLLGKAMTLPKGNARVFFRVPGGGDWSNTEIEIDARHPIELVFVDVDVSKEEGKV